MHVLLENQCMQTNQNFKNPKAKKATQIQVPKAVSRTMNYPVTNKDSFKLFNAGVQIQLPTQNTR